MKKSITLLIILISLLGIIPAQAEDEELAAVYSIGLLDSETVLYSVLFASGTESLGNLTVTADIPADMTFVESLEMPKSATFVEATATQVIWQMEEVAPNSILGPFTYRAEKAAESIAPKSVPATLTWETPEAGTTTAPVIEGELTPLADFGELVLEPTGTVNEAGENTYVQVEDTGVWVFLLPESITETTTLTVARQPVTNMPTDIEDTWWCALVSFAIDPLIAFSQPIGVIIPTRRILTPGLPVHMFTQDSQGTWQGVAEVLPGEAGNVCTAIGAGVVCTVYNMAPATSAVNSVASRGDNPDLYSAPEQGFQGGGQFGGQFGGGFGGGQFGGGGFQGGGQFGGQFGGGGSGAGFGVNVEERAEGYIAPERLAQLGVESAIELLQFLAMMPTQ